MIKLKQDLHTFLLQIRGVQTISIIYHYDQVLEPYDPLY